MARDMCNEVIQKISNTGQLFFECPGCGFAHVVDTKKWRFNGDFTRPTISPSILVRWDEGEERTKQICHSYVTDGDIRFLNDCTHDLAGMTISLSRLK